MESKEMKLFCMCTYLTSHKCYNSIVLGFSKSLRNSESHCAPTAPSTTRWSQLSVTLMTFAALNLQKDKEDLNAWTSMKNTHCLFVCLFIYFTEVLCCTEKYLLLSPALWWPETKQIPCPQNYKIHNVPVLYLNHQMHTTNICVEQLRKTSTSV